MAELYVVCPTYAVDDGQAEGFVLMRKGDQGAAEPWPILITRKGSKFYGFENACPHAGSRLDTRQGEFLDEDGNFLTCGKHRAQFDIDTGHCFIGPCQGAQLKPVALVIDDGDICITGVDLAEEDGLDLLDPDQMPEVMITSD